MTWGCVRVKRLMDEIIVYTDGAASGNPGPGGWGSIVYIQSQNRVKELGQGVSHTTNNKMELLALYETFKFLKPYKGNANFFIDSQYVLNGIQKWVFDWEKNGFKTKEGKEVQHKELWIDILAHLRELKLNGLKMNWNFVKGHSGSIGNERADQIAVFFSKQGDCELFDGAYSEYPYDLIKKNTKFTAYYLAFFKGEIKKFQKWSECEAYVKGKAGIKFKKINNELEESKIAKTWNLK